MWRELLQALEPDVDFQDPVEASALEAAGEALGATLPTSLQSLLQELDGALGEYGLGLVWPLRRIVEDNLTFRSNSDFGELYMPFEPLLFFGDGGNGDQFAFVSRPPRDDVFVWDHETARLITWRGQATLKV